VRGKRKGGKGGKDWAFFHFEAQSLEPPPSYLGFLKLSVLTSTVMPALVAGIHVLKPNSHA